MSELRKANTDYAYFLTIPVVGWIDIFTRQDYCEIIVDSLAFCQREKDLELYAYVIMPSHLHMVARRKEGLMSDLLRDFKSFTAQEILNAIQSSDRESRKEWLLHMFRFYGKYQKRNKEFQFWQKTSHPIELSYPEILQQKINYVHANPVKAGIVSEESYYNYSSANPQSRLSVEAP